MGDGVDRDAYLEQNEKILASVPVYPGAERTDIRHSPYYDGDSADAPVAGYTTTFVFALPQGASREDVARFYKQRVGRAWVLDEEIVEARGERVVNFHRDNAVLSVNLESRRILELAADHDSLDRPTPR